MSCFGVATTFPRISDSSEVKLTGSMSRMEPRNGIFTRVTALMFRVSSSAWFRAASAFSSSATRSATAPPSEVGVMLMRTHLMLFGTLKGMPTKARQGVVTKVVSASLPFAFGKRSDDPRLRA